MDNIFLLDEAFDGQGDTWKRVKLMFSEKYGIIISLNNEVKWRLLLRQTVLAKHQISPKPWRTHGARNSLLQYLQQEPIYNIKSEYIR